MFWGPVAELFWQSVVIHALDSLCLLTGLWPEVQEPVHPRSDPGIKIPASSLPCEKIPGPFHSLSESPGAAAPAARPAICSFIDFFLQLSSLSCLLSTPSHSASWGHLLNNHLYSNPCCSIGSGVLCSKTAWGQDSTFIPLQGH